MRAAAPLRVLGQAVLSLLLAGLVPGSARAQQPAQLAWWVDSLRIYVEGATRLKYRHPPRVALHTPAQIAAYLRRQLDQRLPPGRLDAIAAAYHLLGLLPDTLAFRNAVLDFNAASVARVLRSRDRHALLSDRIRPGAGPGSPHPRDGARAAGAVCEPRLADRSFAGERSGVCLEGGHRGPGDVCDSSASRGRPDVVAYTGVWNALVETVRLRTVATPRTRRIPCSCSRASSRPTCSAPSS